MKLSHCLTIGLVLGSLASAALGYDWVLQNPWPTTHALNDVDFVSATTGWAVGWSGEVLKTTDAGQSWLSQRREGVWSFYDVQFRDEANGWAFGTGQTCPPTGRISHTTDGGETWNDFFAPCGSINEGCFVTDDIGWVADGSRIIHTTDGGETWVTQLVGDTVNPASVTFLSANYGWAAGWSAPDSQLVVARTRDGGVNWLTQHLASLPWAYPRLFFLNSQEGWLGASSENSLREPVTVLYHTSDGGRNWTPQTVPQRSQLNRILFTDPSHGWICQAHTILHTTNGGASWDSQPQDMLSPAGIDVLEGQTTLDVGDEGQISKTTDSGASWQNVSRGSHDNLRAAAFTSETSGWVVGDSPDQLYATTDGGANWRYVPLGFSGWFQTIALADRNNGWLAGYNGAIAHTTDGGQSWRPQTSGTDCELWAICALNASEAWVCGNTWVPDNLGRTPVVILHTSNGGQNWTESYHENSGKIFALAFNSPASGWAVGDSGLVLHTTDHGQTWNPLDLEAVNYRFVGIQFSDVNHGWLIATSNLANHYAFAMRTANGGDTWEAVPLTYFHEMTAVSFSDSLHGWIAGQGSASSWIVPRIIHTTDGGDTWTETTTEVNELVFNMDMVNDSLGWLVGYAGMIMRYGTPQSEVAPEARAHVAATLDLAAYPNPFNAVTEIRYDLAGMSRVRLTIVNLLGRQVATLVDEMRPAGSHAVAWNAADIPSGMYFAVLEAGSVRRIQKLVLLK